MIRPGVFRDTFEESFRNKMFLLFFIVASLIIATITLALNMDVVNGALQGVTLFGNEVRVPGGSLSRLVEGLQSGLAMFIGTVGLFLALMATSTLIPSILQKGTIELLLCRPIPRWRIIGARFLGSVSIMAFNGAYLFIGVWVALGLKSGVWNSGFPLSIFLLVFAFVVLFALMALLSTVTENGPVGLLAAYTVLLFSPILALHDRITPAFSQELYRLAFRFLYWLLPKTAETISGMRRLITGQEQDLALVLLSSAAFGAICLGATMVYFTRKDY